MTTTVVTIDVNARVGDETYVAFDQVVGPMAIGGDAMIIEPMAGLIGNGKITEIDQAGKRVLVSVEWDSLVVPPEDTSPDVGGGDSPFESGINKYGWKAIGPGGFRFNGPKGAPAPMKSGPAIAHAGAPSAPKVTVVDPAPAPPADAAPQE